MILSIALVALLSCTRGAPTAGESDASVHVVEVTPPSTSMWVSGTMQFHAIPKDSTGAVIEGRSVTWTTSASSVVSVNGSGLVTAKGPGSAMVTAESGGQSGAATVTVSPAPSAGAPVYDAGNPAHVLHVFEDWSTYPSIAAIGTTARVDGGGAWQNSEPQWKTFSTNVDPWFGRKAVTIDLQAAPGPQQALTRGFVLTQAGTPVRYLNAASAQASLVIEWAVRQAGTGIYLGKQADWVPQGSMYRFNFQNSWDRLGDRTNATCDGDPLCSHYYTTNGTTPRVSGTPPSASMFGDQFARSFTEGSTIKVHHWNQNRNWGTGAGQFDPAVTTNAQGQRQSAFLDNVWRRYVIRLTLNQPGQPVGHGRVELWLQRAGGPMIKLMDFIGDTGMPDAGLVHTGPSTGSWINSAAGMHWYDLTAVGPIYQGGNTLTLGYFRMWSHPRLPVP